MNQVYTRSAPTTRLVYVRSDPALGTASGTVFRIVRPLYGLADAGDSWWRKIKKNCIMLDLRLVQCKSDPCIFYMDGSKPPSMLGAYVCDLLFVGGSNMPKVAK